MMKKSLFIGLLMLFFSFSMLQPTGLINVAKITLGSTFLVATGLFARQIWQNYHVTSTLTNLIYERTNRIERTQGEIKEDTTQLCENMSHLDKKVQSIGSVAMTNQKFLAINFLGIYLTASPENQEILKRTFFELKLDEKLAREFSPQNLSKLISEGSATFVESEKIKV